MRKQNKQIERTRYSVKIKHVKNTIKINTQIFLLDYFEIHLLFIILIFTLLLMIDKP